MGRSIGGAVTSVAVSVALGLWASVASVGPVRAQDAAFDAAVETAGDEFADPVQAATLEPSILRVNRKGADSGTWRYGQSRVGVVIAPERVLTTADVFMTYDPADPSQLEVYDGGTYRAVSRVDVDRSRNLLILDVPGLQATAVSIAQTPFSGGALFGFGYTFDLDERRADAVTWNVVRRSRYAASTTGLVVGSDISDAGVVVTDACGRLVGLRGATGEEGQLIPGSTVAVGSIRAFLDGVGIDYAPGIGVCATGAVRDAVRQARAAVIEQDQAAVTAVLGARSEARRQREMEREWHRTRVIGAALFGGVGAVCAFLFLVAGKSAPRRRLALVLIFAGFVPTAGGLALDGLRALGQPLDEGPTVHRLTCRSSAGDVKDVIVEDYGRTACVNDGTDATPYVLVASPDGTGAVFERRIRPQDATRDGADVVVDVRRMSLDGRAWSTTRGVMGSVYEAAAKDAFAVERDAIRGCSGLTTSVLEPSAAEWGLRRRREFSQPHLRRTGERTTRSYTCSPATAPVSSPAG